MIRRFVAAGACLGLVVSASGCGYALVGRGTVVDPSIQVIGVPLFTDRTGKPGLDQKVTDLVIAELLKRGRFEVIPQRAGADAVVVGELTGYQAAPVGFSEGADANTEASRYEVALIANVTYSKVGATEPIWQNGNFRSTDEYDVGDPQAFFDREEQAIDRLAEQFARDVVAAMMEAF